MNIKDFKDIFVRPGLNLPALDGIRAIAILLVVGSHVNAHFLTAGGLDSIVGQLPPFKGGWIGVPLFFILSGYLIGSQIWKEYLKTNSIKFWAFVLRRGLRIWPLYFFCMIIIGFFFFDGTPPIEGILSNILFLSNYWNDSGPIFGAWSLSTEEHFYILAPLFILFVTKYFGNKDLKYFRKILYVLFFVPCILRALTWQYISPDGEFHLAKYMISIYRPIHTNCEGLIVGMILSNIMRDCSFVRPKILNKPYLLLLIGALLFGFSFLSKVHFNFMGVAFGFGCLVWLGINHEGPISRVLSSTIFFPIAKTSYGTYLIHIPVINYVFEHNILGLVKMNPIVGLITSFLLVNLLCVFIGSFLYVLIEKPFMQVRKNVLAKFES
jgi:peptidoglycan/LPS O-acetylase OafA/YrhL